MADIPQSFDAPDDDFVGPPAAGGKPVASLDELKRILGASGRDLTPAAEQSASEALVSGESTIDVANRLRKTPGATTPRGMAATPAEEPGIFDDISSKFGKVVTGKADLGQAISRGISGRPGGFEPTRPGTPAAASSEPEFPAPATPPEPSVPASPEAAPDETREAVEQSSNEVSPGGTTPPATPPPAEPEAPRAPGSFRASAKATSQAGGHVPADEAASIVANVVKAPTPQSMKDLIQKLDTEGEELTTRLGQEGKTPDMVQQDLQVWRDKKDDIWDLYRENRSRLDWASGAEVFGQLLVQWMAGAHGMRTGVDMTGVKFRLQDWSKRYDHLLAESKAEIQSLEADREAETKQVEATNKEITDFRKRRQEGQEKLGEYEGRAELENAKETNQALLKDKELKQAYLMHREDLAAKYAQIAASREKTKDLTQANAYLKSQSDDARKDLDDFDAAVQRVVGAGLKPKSKDEQNAVTSGLEMIARTTNDPKVHGALRKYKEDESGFWSSWGDVQGDLVKALGPARKDLLGRKMATDDEWREVSGVSRRRDERTGSPAAGGFPRTVRKDGKVATVSNDAELQDAQSKGWN